MMLASNKLRVALATTHIPLKNVPRKITKSLIVKKVKILDKDLRNKFKIKNPKIKILGLNPHAGENGKIGKEELEHIKPAVKELKKQNINVSMPISADTAFSQKVLNETDMSAEDIARKSIKVASDICVFTNNNVTVEKI